MIRKSYIAIVAGLILTALCCLPLAAQDVDNLKFPKLNEIKVPQIERVTLDNGLRLYLLEDKSLPVFNVSVRLNCGSYLEPADKVGLAEICGTVMRTGGTQKWTGDQIDEMLEGIGGSVESSIDVVSGTAFVNVLSEYTDLGLEVLAEVLRRPVFNEDKIELAKVQQRTAVSRRNDDMTELTRQEYIKLIYGNDSPYARHTEYKTINAITRDDLVAFHKMYFQPQNMQMAILGDFDKKDILARLEKYFSDWPRGSAAVPPPPEVGYEWRSKVYYAEKADAAQSHIRVGHIGGLVTAPDYPDMLVVSSILGGGFGSRITEAVRTKLGLAYTPGGRYVSDFAYPGYFFIVASTGSQTTIQATREIIKQIKSMHTDPPTTAEMQKGKDGYLNSFVFNFDSRREVVDRMMEYDFYGLP
ncbi:MAG: insulinase family protein, partial [candidate division Zixibacteria bacterium]|nr:insulinase family protein [candidate division Zixibacteria bacterium]